MMTDIEIISKPSDYDFPNDWYELADENHFWSKSRLNAFLSEIESKNINLNGQRGLEIGCGNGLFRRQLESIFSCTIDGADIVMSGLETNKTKRGRTFFYDIHEKNDQFKDSYDFIILFDVLEHIDDTEKFIESALFHVKKGGLIFINVPAMKQLYSRYDEVVGHIRRYDKKLIRKELGSQNIKIIDIRYWGLSMIPILFLRKWFSSDKAPDQAIIKKGFNPPSPLINSFLGLIIKLEQFFLKRPLRGTSLLAIATKK